MKIPYKPVILFSIIISFSLIITSFFVIQYVEAAVIDSGVLEMTKTVTIKQQQIQTLHERSSEDLVFALQNPLFVEYFDLPETKAGNVYDEVELTLESIQKVDDPYQTFVDSIKNKETFRKYNSHLYGFLKLVPNSIYSEKLGETPFDDSIETLSNFFVHLAEKDPKIARNVITAFIKEDCKQVEEELLR